MTRPLAIDLCCGLGGWAEGLMLEGFDVIGFDVERHVYGEHRYPAQLVLQDVMTLHGKQFKDAELIVASPPCVEFSYMAMPWQRSKQIARALLQQQDWLRSLEFPAGYKGSRSQRELTSLFDACFRIQREACAAASRHIPLIVENVCGAQPWVGPARARYGSYYLWGDVRSVPQIATGRAHKSSGMNWSDPEKRGQDFTRVAGNQAIKNSGGSWFKVAHNTTSGKGRNPDGRNEFQHANLADGVKRGHSKGMRRRFAQAMIAKIPLELSRHIGRAFYPRSCSAESANRKQVAA